MIAITPISQPPESLAGYDPARDAGDCTWDEQAAGRAVAFFPRYLHHIAGHTGPFQLDPWQRDYVATLFGWLRPDGTRRYRESLLAVPRKNGKTTLAAGLGLYVLTCDQEQGAQVYCAASDRDQATLVFDPASKMVKGNASLSKRLKVIDSTKRILYPATNSFMRAIPADAAGSHGFNAHAVVMDELHTQPDRALYDVLKTSMASRAQPLLVSITTAGYDRESICYEVWDYARRIRDGVVKDPTFLPVLYEATTDDDWTDRNLWHRVNPGLGQSVSLDYLEETFERALVTPALETTFKNLHLNMWTDSAETWLSSAAWELCGGDVDWPNLTGRECFVGIDLGSTDDLTAVVYVFPIDGKYYVKCHVWCSGETVREARKNWQAQYRTWNDQGWLHLTSGKSTDYQEVLKQILLDAQTYRIAAIGYDYYRARELVEVQLEANYGFKVVKIPQTTAGLGAGTSAVEIAVADGLLRHDNNPILNWCVQSATPYEDTNGNRKLDKKSSAGKIDAAVAMVMAMLLAKVEQSNAPGLLWV